MYYIIYSNIIFQTNRSHWKLQDQNKNTNKINYKYYHSITTHTLTFETKNYILMIVSGYALLCIEQQTANTINIVI